jgi:hypothetical protein
MLSDNLPVSDSMGVVIPVILLCPGSTSPCEIPYCTPNGQNRQTPRPIVQHSIPQVGIRQTDHNPSAS